MQSPALPNDEELRLEALLSLKLLDTAPDPRFDNIVQLGQKFFGVDICLISLVDRDRQWFKAKCGLDASETPREISFCGHAILGDDVFIVRNALEDSRFADNPLVTGPPHIRFYAGAPLRLPNGYKIGTLCIISSQPRPGFGAKDARELAQLGSLVINAITLDALTWERGVWTETNERVEALVKMCSAPMASVGRNGEIDSANPAFAAVAGQPSVDGVLLRDVLDLQPDWVKRFRAKDDVAAAFKNAPEQGVRIRAFKDGFLVAS